MMELSCLYVSNLGWLNYDMECEEYQCLSLEEQYFLSDLVFWLYQDVEGDI